MMKTDKNIVLWYFQVGDLSSDESNTEWIKYRDIEMEIIEEAYQEGKIEVFLDTCRINLKDFIQVSESDPRQCCRVRRDVNYQPENILREERFHTELVLPLARSYGSAQAWCPFLNAWLDSSAGKRAVIDFYSAVDACIDGILQEAIKSETNSVNEAKWMVKQLYKAKTKSRREVTKICIHLYTRESFLYRILNTAVRNNDQSKIATLGPLGYLIQDYSRTCEGFIGTVYRGVQLSPEQILMYEQAIGLRYTWPSFTSTSKNRKIAEIIGNTLFVITIVDCKFRCTVRGVDISEVSQFPNEEEIMLPAGLLFEIVAVRKDPSQKYIIEIKV